VRPIQHDHGARTIHRREKGDRILQELDPPAPEDKWTSQKWRRGFQILPWLSLLPPGVCWQFLPRLPHLSAFFLPLVTPWQRSGVVCHVIILRNACIYEVRPQVLSGLQTRRSSTWISPYGLCFFLWPLVSEGAFCYKVQVTFIWCGINGFSSTWNDRKRIWVGTHITCLCVCRVRLPTWFVSLTNNVDNQFWLVFSTTFQYPNFYYSVISIFDGRRRSVNTSSIDSAIDNKMKIETSMTSQVGKNIRPYFQCVHHRLAPGKHPQLHCYSNFHIEIQLYKHIRLNKFDQ